MSWSIWPNEQVADGEITGEAEPSRQHTSHPMTARADGFDPEELAEVIFIRLHPFMAWLAALFVLVLVGDAIVGSESPFATIFTIAGWMIWGVFVIDFIVRMVAAPSTTGFLRRNWWQVLFLVLPFLALFRFLMALRIARAGRLVSAAVRGTRSAAAGLRSRLATIGAVTVMVILLAANVLFEFGGVSPYSDALHAAALATIAGEAVAGGRGVAKLLDVVLALYSVVIFAAVAGALGAFFLEGDRGDERAFRKSDDAINHAKVP